jgi:hypothetical protein
MHDFWTLDHEGIGSRLVIQPKSKSDLRPWHLTIQLAPFILIFRVIFVKKFKVFTVNVIQFDSLFFTTLKWL